MVTLPLQQPWAEVDVARVREINNAWLGGKAGFNGGK
jgi:hypothetical protein